MAWTENPKDDQAKDLDKFKAQALHALQSTSQALGGAQGLDSQHGALNDGVTHFWVFISAQRRASPFGPQRCRSLGTRNSALSGTQEGAHHAAGRTECARLCHGSAARRSYARHSRTGERNVWPQPVRGLADCRRAGQRLRSPERSAQHGDDFAAPFDANVGTELSAALNPETASGDAPSKEMIDFVHDHYADSPWRRIDFDWLGMSADLAMQLDDRTNNTSLVLAFEFIDSDRVMLFTADAQVGNWLSWEKLEWHVDGRGTVKGHDLLARTIYYKVGHHGSHNATLKQKGLELMTHPDLGAFIPTNAQDAKKVNWGQMPFKDIVDELNRRTSGRVVRADDAWIATPQMGANFQTPSGAIQALRHKQGLYVEFDIE